MNTSTNTHANALLRQERIGRDWRQRDLAEQLGTTVVTVKRWERGYQQPSLYFRVKLCTLFGKSAQELGLVDVASVSPITKEDVSATEQASFSPAESLALWTVPYRRNPHFTGRDELLERLTQHLTPACSEEPTNTRRAVLTQPRAIKGLGGIGKTQIALEYAYRAREQGRYTHTLWIHAAHEETILSSFVALAQLLPEGVVHPETNPHQLVAQVIRWLEQCQEPWLLIFDNADELPLVQPYLLCQGKGSVLLTTRSQAVAALASSLDVEAMGVMEGIQFLLHRTHQLDATDEQSNEAANVVIALDGFPLALDQAGAYIEETGCSFGDYLRLYEQHRTRLLVRWGKQAGNYPNSVATTFMATTCLGMLQEVDNQLSLATQTYRRVLQLVGESPLPIAYEAHFGLARIYYEWNNLDEASQHGQQSIQLMRQMENTDRFVTCEVFLARLKLALGDVAGFFSP